jgi:hypothetical protein
VWVDVLGTTVHRRAILDPDKRPTGKQVYWFDAITRDLLGMINRFGREYGVRVPFTNAKQLGVRIANELATLSQAGWKTAHLKMLHGDSVKRWAWSDAEHWDAGLITPADAENRAEGAIK